MVSKKRHVLCLVAQSCLTLCDPMDCSPPGSSVHGGSPGKDIGAGCHALLQGIFPAQGANLVSTVPVDSWPAEPPGKPKTTAVGSLSLFQGIFPTQESNWGLLHCRRILYAKLPGKPELVGTWGLSCVAGYGEHPREGSAKTGLWLPTGG